MRSASDEDDMSSSRTRSTAGNDLEEFERQLHALAMQRASAEDPLLVELAQRLAPVRSSRDNQAVSEPGRTDSKPGQPLEMPMLRPSIDAASDDARETATFDGTVKLAEGRNLKVSALALGGMVVVAALFDFARDPSGNMSSHGSFAPAAGISATPVAATVDTPIVAALIASPPPPPSQFPDPKAVPAISLRPDGAPITMPSSAAESSKAGQTAEAAKPAAKARPKAGKSTARIVVAKADAAAPDAAAETPVLPAAPAKPEKTTGATSKVPPATADTPMSTPPQAAPAEQPANALTRAFGDLVGSLAAPATSARQPVDSTAATTSSGWAVQLAAPKSEMGAKSEAARLYARYASALSGAAIGVHEAQVNGATVYRLRVVGLSKADAAALCARMKRDGGHCFVAK